MAVPKYPNASAINAGANAFEQAKAAGFPAGSGGSAPQQGGDAASRMYYTLLDMGYPPEIAMEKAFPQGGGAPSAADFMAMGFSPEQAQRAAQAAALSSADLPAGFINELMGKGGAGGGGSAAALRPQTEVDPRTGELIMIGPDGSVVRTGEQVGFAGVDPRAEYEEEARRADNTLAMQGAGFADSAAQWRALLGENALMDRAGFREKGVMDRATLQERGLMDRATLDENARQADTGFALDEFRTRANLVPQLGQLALGASEQQRQIFSEGGDYLARAYGQANQNSPLGLVTQADMANKLMANLSQIEGMIPESRVTGRQRYAGAPGFYMPDFNDVPDFAAPGAYVPPSLRGFNPLAPAPEMGPRQAYRGRGAGGGGGAASAAPASSFAWSSADEAMAAPRGAPVADAPPASGRGPVTWGGPRSDYSAGGGFQWPSEDEAMAAPRGDTPPNYDWQKPRDPIFGALNDFWNFLGPPKPSAAPPSRQGPYSGYKDGTPSMGFTTEPAFVINEAGPELVENLDGGRIRIHDAKATKKMVGPHMMSGYDEGTASEGVDLSRIDPAMLEEMYLMMGTGPGNAARGLWGAAPAGVKAGTSIQNAAARKITPELLRAAGFPAASGGPGGKPNFAKLLTRVYGALDDKVRDIPGFETGTWGATAALEQFNSGRGASGLADFNAAVAAQTGAPVAGFNGWGTGGGFTPASAAAPAPRANAPWTFVNPKPGSNMNPYAPGFTDWLMNNPYASDEFTDPSGRLMRRQGKGLPFGYVGDPRAIALSEDSLRRQAGMFSGPPMTQEELQAMALNNAPPRVRSVFEGKNPNAPFIGAGLGDGFRAPTARMLAQLNEDDTAALGTLTNVRSSGKTTLADLMAQAGAMANPQGGGRRARVRGLGL